MNSMRKIHFQPVIPASPMQTLEATRESNASLVAAPATQENMPFVMLIDDSITVRKLVEICLTRAGINVMSYPDGIHAFEAIKRHAHAIPEVLILDVGLPHLDGYTIARLLKSHPSWKHTTILMLSGRTSVLDRLKGRLSGADLYMTKPFRTQELVRVVLNCLGITDIISREGGTSCC